MQGWRDLGKVCLKQANAPLPAAQASSSLCPLAPTVPDASMDAAGLTLGALALLEGQVVQSSPFILAARGQAPRKCTEKLQKGRKMTAVFSAQSGSITSHLSPDLTSLRWLTSTKITNCAPPGASLLLLSSCWGWENSARSGNETRM